MLTKPLAQTSIQLPAIGQGAGDTFFASDIPYRKKVALLRMGIKLGMGFIDTSEFYGDGLSEEIVGEAIEPVREHVVVATKVWSNHLSYEEVLKAADRSLKRLKTDYIDLYQIHWPNPSIPISETMAAFRVLLEAGKIRSAGVCNFTPREVGAAQDAFGEYQLVSVQNEYNLLERTVEYNGLLSHCVDHEMVLIAWGPLDLGRISTISGRRLKVLSSIANKHDRSIPQVALRWLVSHPSVVAIPGTTKEQHLIQNGEASDFDLSDEEVEQINSAFSDVIVHPDTNRIRVSDLADKSDSQMLDEKLENILGYAPSPLLKPVRLVRSPDPNFDYDLIEGRCRYRGWVNAHGGKAPIPAYVQE